MHNAILSCILFHAPDSDNTCVPFAESSKYRGGNILTSVTEVESIHLWVLVDNGTYHLG